MKENLSTCKDREIRRSLIRQLPSGKHGTYPPPHTRRLWLAITLFSFIPLFFLTRLNAQPLKQWDKTFGSNKMDLLSSVKQTSDGGFILGGSSESDAGGEKTQGHYGAYGSDYWIVKLAANGIKEWDKIIGGRADDVLVSLQKTIDGGYILGGRSNSGAFEDKTENPKGFEDFWIVKLDANGVKQWDKTIGSTAFDGLRDVRQTADGGYIVGGYTAADAGADKSENSKGSFDYWVVKLNGNGEKQWDKTYGTTFSDFLYCIIPTTDGGYIMGGSSESGINGDKSEASRGLVDYWIIKADATGAKQWDKTIGANAEDYISVIQQTSDGGFIIGGNSLSGASGEKTGAGFGNSDYWVVKLDGTGTKIWDKTLGGGSMEELSFVQETFNGGYILAGYSVSAASGNKTEEPIGLTDYWVVKLSADGTTQWDKTIGGTGDDFLRAIQRTADGGYILGGSSSSDADGDKSEVSRGERDYWVVKLAPDEDPMPVVLTRFDVKNEGYTALLQWTTTSETQSDRFEIEHSIDAKSWKRIGIREATGTSQSLLNYEYVHVSPVLNANNFYRLKMIDTDNSFAYSSIKTLRFDTFHEPVIAFPNPATVSLSFQIADLQNIDDIELLDSRSASVYHSGKIPVKDVDVRKLHSGLYFLKVSRKDGSASTHKIVINR